MSHRCIAFFGCVAAALGFFVSTAAAVELVPHRAVYRMALGTATSGSGIVDAEGTMLYRFAAECEGWIVETKSYLVLRYAAGDEVRTSWSFTSWESRDGRAYRFDVRHDRDGQIVEQLRGRAALDAGVARYSLPAEATVDLPAGTLFPTAHLQAVLKAARNGTRQLAKTVFDGASLDNPYEVSAFIGQVPATEQKALAQAAGLKERPAWRMRWAFFPVLSNEPAPDFEIGVRYREDGIADQLMQEFAEFSLDIKLGDLEVLPAPDC